MVMISMKVIGIVSYEYDFWYASRKKYSCEAFHYLASDSVVLPHLKLWSLVRGSSCTFVSINLFNLNFGIWPHVTDIHSLVPRSLPDFILQPRCLLTASSFTSTKSLCRCKRKVFCVYAGHKGLWKQKAAHRIVLKQVAAIITDKQNRW